MVNLKRPALRPAHPVWSRTGNQTLVERKERIAPSLFPSSRETDEIAEAVFLHVQPELGGGSSRTTFIFFITPRLHSPPKRPPSLQVVKLLTTQIPLLQILGFTPPFFVPFNLRKVQINLLQARLCTASINYSSAPSRRLRLAERGHRIHGEPSSANAVRCSRFVVCRSPE
jgi:hypothetical protein